MRKKLLLLFLFQLCIFYIVQAQTRVINGKVTDENGAPIAQASILVKGTNNGTATNEQGNFTLNVTGSQILVFSATGTETKELATGNRSTFNVTLANLSGNLDEVIVVAYGTAKKSDFTGSSAQINAKEIEKRPIVNVTNALVGSAPGIQTTSSSGAPGSGPSIRLRGFGSVNASSSPLIVVDGAVYDGGIANINPDDVESISTLKDASTTALYGSRGANGVIMITTKKGKKNSDQISFKITNGVTSRGLPEYDRVSAAEYYPLMWQSYRNNLANAAAPNNIPLSVASDIASGLLPRIPEGQANAGKQTYMGKAYDDITQILGYNPFNVPNTELMLPNGELNPNAKLKYEEDLDWQKAFMDVGQRNDYSMSYNGGNEKSDYFGSFSYNNEKGYATRSEIQRFSGRLSVNTNPVKWFKTGLNLSGTNINTSSTNDGTGIVNPFSFSRAMGPIYPVHAHDPQTGDYMLDVNGKKIYDIGGMPGVGNRPIYGGRHAIYENILNEDKYKRSYLSGRGYGTIIVNPHLKLTTNISLDVQDILSQGYDNKIVGDGAPSGRSNREANKVTSYTFNQLVNYSRQFGSHNIDVLAGHENYDYTYNYLYGFRIEQIVDGNTEFSNFTTTSSLSSRTDKYRMESYLSRVNYDYEGKYFFSGSLRRDGNSRFYKDVRWDNFWSVGAAWRLDKESFININWINQLKLRGSFGRVGNDAGIGYYPYMALYGLGYNNASAPGFVQTTLANNELTWEGSQSMDVGVDFSLFNNRLSGTVEYFNRISDHLIFDVGQPLSNGGTTSGELSVYTNIGSMYNRGWELQLSGFIISKKDFTWNMTVNATSFKNKITKMPDTQKEIISGTKQLKEGRSIYDFYLRDFYGVDPNDGAALYKNVITWNDANSREISNGKGGFDTVTTKITNAKYVYVDKTSIPAVYGGIQNTFTYKNIDLSFMFTYQIGGYAYDNGYVGLMHAGSYGTALHKDMLKAWKNPGDVTNVPRLENNVNADLAGASDRWLMDASYLNFNNISLGYSLPVSLLNKVYAKSVKVYLSGENLALYGKRKGTLVNQGFAGTNSAGYPPVRILSAGINVTF